MADAGNRGTEDVLVKEEEVLKEEELALEGVVERSDAVEESVKGLAAALKEKEVLVESEAFEASPIPVEDGKGAEIMDPVVVVAGEESGGTAYVVAKELEEPSEVPPAVVEQEEIPDSTGNPAAISASARTVPPTSWWNCCGLFDVLQRS